MDLDLCVLRLKSGDIRFFDFLSSYEIESLLKYVRSLDSYDQILAGSFSSLSQKYPTYAFLLVYDRDAYQAFCQSYLENDFSILFHPRFFHSFLGSSRWSATYVLEHLRYLVSANRDLVFSMVRYGVTSDEPFLKHLLYCDDLFVRGYVMLELLDNFPHLFLHYYPNVTDYLVKKNGNGDFAIVEEEIASKIAYLLVDQHLNMEQYYSVKEFIFAQYKNNILASLLAGAVQPMAFGPDYGTYFSLIEEDMTRFFLTSRNYKYELYKNGKGFISSDILLAFQKQIEPFVAIYEEMISYIFLCELGDKFLSYASSYLEKTTGAKVIADAGRGSTTRAFRVGDYVLKCSDKKWEAEECPDLYLFAKCFEKNYVRDSLGNIVGALEVQQYYSQAVSIKESAVIERFREALKELGYEVHDQVLGFQRTSNFFRLPTYQDADCESPEELPEWFKKDPVVWVDRDLVRRIKK